ncbi:autoinducer-2 kinase [Sinisalibacter aestuarii]|uniref:Autoinducer-2 kinase n=1 Tax=Sinisalibacter aestuarii TaxID=2949426 RepID=A0ABQ5LVU5_9RHOB|nr:autoinducer-2 kinase [Sinisalibacter aestuarii]GKY89115.1 autoinducer-2 kinase [Sinisalibacter aestuarii]
MSTHLLVLDAGTGSVRAVVFDRDGRQIGVSQEEWTHLPEAGVPGSMAFDVAGGWARVKRVIAGALKACGLTGKDIAAISSTSMREAIVLYGDDGREVWACANVDSRASAEVAELRTRSADYERRFYEVSGETFALGALPRLTWLQKHRPDLFAQVRSISMVNDWIAARMTGEITVEPTNGSTNGLMDLARRDWSDELISLAGLDRAMFPRVVEPGTAIGTVTRAAADETGLAEGTPVVAGGGDVQLGSVGLGVLDLGDAAVLGGTFWQQVVNIPPGSVDKTMRLRVNSAAVPQMNQAEAISFFVGLTARWFRDAFCQEEIRKAAEQGRDAYELMEDLAMEVPAGAHGIIPVFSDAMDFGNWYHAAPSFLNLSIDPAIANKGSMFRAIQENAAIVAAINLARVEEFAGVGGSGALILAGGASKGRLWPQIVADVTGRQIRIPRVREATALGGAAAAATGIGQFANLPEAGRTFVEWDRTVEPNPANRGVYDEARERWQVAYAAQKALVDEGVTTSMWRAPGT